ncbi:hypothetical protein Mlute_00912 [Meiothermus luteus]|uniref:Uncharacterized protein n=1 Tax=Meiothermus luteus TaxID=2026184 RepID=A0A399EYJ0_9DEIN|nr:hypothetical protein [Meiothermus luteus]RIH87602.1 hypothetical protein Mlute_00912 [Meiothermus luteus]RMH53996.1 MAG: hypothetical protein D6684_10790 [Deinococcota bacterium]
MKPQARKFRFGELPPEREAWEGLSVEVRLRAVREMVLFWTKLKGQDIRGIAPVARRRAWGELE